MLILDINYTTTSRGQPISTKKLVCNIFAPFGAYMQQVLRPDTQNSYKVAFIAHRLFTLMDP